MTEVYGARPVERHRRSRGELEAVDAAIVAAVEQDYPVTLRGVYYRVVSAGAVEKTENGYKLVGRQLLKLRRAGVVPYARITDGTRHQFRIRSWSDPSAALDALASSYRKMLWLDQPVAVEVFSEKDAISGVVAPVTERWDVPLGIVRGYSSETFAHAVAAGLDRQRTNVLYQLGDHDPSGVDAWRVFAERVRGFAPDVGIVFERLAVTEEQIERLNLPTRPTKASDSRARGFRGESVEVDAIPAGTLRDLVEDAIVSHLDPDRYALTRHAEEQERAGLEMLAGIGGSVAEWGTS